MPGQEFKKGYEISHPKVYINTYGCQMNVSDSQVVASIMKDNGFSIVDDYTVANIIFINTCSVRENAELRVRRRLNVFKHLKKEKPGLLIGIIGCMAERLKEKLLDEEKIVDIVAGPDSYRELPDLIKTAETGQKAINVHLSHTETYSDITPFRYDSNNVSAFVSIMRGCNNYCSYCVVPFTRGRERSRSPLTILKEIQELIDNGFKEVTLLGQNVNSYMWEKEKLNFARLLEMVAKHSPDLRIRFTTSHPKDLADDILYTMAKYDNICKNIHLPVQSGNSRILKIMKREYTRQWYLDRINAIRRIIPDCAVSTDILSGFCSETEDEHKDTLSLMKLVKFDFAYMFKYSERPDTYAQKNLKDDVPDTVKSGRLTEIIELQQKLSYESNKRDLNKVFQVLIEGVSKKSKEHLFGRNSQNKVVVFPRKNFKIGDYVDVMVTKCTSATLIGD